MSGIAASVGTDNPPSDEELVKLAKFIESKARSRDKKSQIFEADILTKLKACTSLKKTTNEDYEKGFVSLVDECKIATDAGEVAIVCKYSIRTRANELKSNKDKLIKKGGDSESTKVFEVKFHEEHDGPRVKGLGQAGMGMCGVWLASCLENAITKEMGLEKLVNSCHGGGGKIPQNLTMGGVMVVTMTKRADYDEEEKDDFEDEYSGEEVMYSDEEDE